MMSVRSTQYPALSARFPVLSQWQTTPDCFTSSSIVLPPAARRSSDPRFAGNGVCQGEWKVLCVCGEKTDTDHETPLATARRRNTSPSTADVAADRVQQQPGLRRLRHRVSSARAAAVQLQQPAGGLPEVRGIRQIVGVDMKLVVPDASKSIRDGAIAPWNTPAYAHELEELLALAPGLRPAGGRALFAIDRRAEEADRAWRARAEFRRARRILRLAAETEVQDAHPRLPQPLAKLPALPGLRRHAAAARGAGRADRRTKYCRDMRDASERGRGVLSPSSHFPTTTAASAATMLEQVRLRLGYPRIGGAGLPDAGPRDAHAQRRRGAAGWLDVGARLQPGEHALRARRAFDRAASRRRRRGSCKRS